jgi:NSS family neurotransmitter:Na+ symporter
MSGQNTGTTSRDQWSSRAGFILAAAGSAIGLGNLWKFPYITWENDGGAFVLVYLMAILAVGLPLMTAEILIGRHTQKSTVPAIEQLGGKSWTVVGALGVLAGFVILGDYAVIAGWSLSRFWQCVGWTMNGFEEYTGDQFGAFVGDATTQISLSLTFMVVTASIVWFGISGGIEKVTKILMPILFLMLLYFLFTAVSLPGAGEAFSFLFAPNFSELGAEGVLEALGHSFFTLSLGMGLMITYGSYLRKSDSVPRVAGIVALMDTLVALVACMIMFSIIFTVPSLSESIGKSTVGMLFITLPNLFYTSMPGGTVLGPLFYLFVGFAALTSTISLLEVMVSFGIDRFGWKRSKSTLICSAVTYFNTIFCALSLGAVGALSTFSIFPNKSGVLDHMDYLASNWMLPLGGFAIAIFAGWKIDKKVSIAELGLVENGAKPSIHYKIWLFFTRFVAPIAIGWVILEVIMGKDFS